MKTSAHRRQIVRDANRRLRMRKKGLEYRAPVASSVDKHSDPSPMGLVRPLTDMPSPREGLRVAYIPDTQLAHGVPMEHLGWCGDYMADKQPDVIVIGGDFGDFGSLSRFLKPGTGEFEGQRYQRDLDAFHRGMDLLMNPIRKAINGWRPKLEFIEGNHENHIPRYVNEHPILQGRMGLEDLRLADYGWRFHPFLHPFSIAGVAFSHYFPSGVMGGPITSARALLTKLHMSAIAGHQQGRDVAYARRADGGHMTAIITGSFYQHNMSYLSPFTNAHWRGMVMLHEVKDGQFDEMWVSINFLKRRFA